MSKNRVVFSGKSTLQTTTTVRLQPMRVLSFFTHDEERLVTIEAFLYPSVDTESLGNLGKTVMTLLREARAYTSPLSNVLVSFSN